MTDLNTARSVHLLHLEGLRQVNRGLLGPAEHTLRRALDLDPGHQPSRITLAEVLLRSESTSAARLSTARRLLEAACRRNPHDVRARHGMARYHLTTGALDLARRELEAVLELSPNDTRAQLELADLEWLEMSAWGATEETLKAITA